MQTGILTALVCGCALGGSALADTVVINDQVQIRESKVDRPQRGLSMDEVEKKYGAPLTRHATVGGGSKQHPPITRWDYRGFAVFFESDRVIDSVVTNGEAAPRPAGAPTPTPAAAPAGPSTSPSA